MRKLNTKTEEDIFRKVDIYLLGHLVKTFPQSSFIARIPGQILGYLTEIASFSASLLHCWRNLTMSIQKSASSWKIDWAG